MSFLSELTLAGFSTSIAQAGGQLTQAGGQLAKEAWATAGSVGGLAVNLFKGAEEQLQIRSLSKNQKEIEKTMGSLKADNPSQCLNGLREINSILNSLLSENDNIVMAISFNMLDGFMSLLDKYDLIKENAEVVGAMKELLNIMIPSTGRHTHLLRLAEEKIKEWFQSNPEVMLDILPSIISSNIIKEIRSEKCDDSQDPIPKKELRLRVVQYLCEKQGYTFSSSFERKMGDPDFFLLVEEMLEFVTDSKQKSPSINSFVQQLLKKLYDKGDCQSAFDHIKTIGDKDEQKRAAGQLNRVLILQRVVNFSSYTVDEVRLAGNLKLFIEQPVLWHLREFSSLDDFKFDSKTSRNLSFITKEEYEVVFTCFKKIENENDKQRAIEGLYDTVKQKKCWGDFGKEEEAFLSDLQLFRQEPLLWHLRKFGSLDEFQFNSKTSSTLTSIIEEEYEVVFSCIKGIDDKDEQKRVIREFRCSIERQDWAVKSLEGLDEYIKDLTLCEQEPVLWHLRKFSSLAGFTFDSKTSSTLTSITEGEYEGVLACFKKIGDEPQKQRAIKGLYGAIALKQLCGGFADKCKALKTEFSDTLKTHEISGREVLTQSDARIDGIDKSGNEKVFYAFSGTKVCSDSPQNNEKRKAFLREIRGYCQECLSGQKQWQEHFYLDRVDGIGDKDFLNFNAQHTCNFTEVASLKNLFNDYIKRNFGEYELQWDAVTRNNFQSRAMAAFNGDPKCREHEDSDSEAKISFCYMVTGNNWTHKEGMGVYVKQEEGKHTSVMGDNQFLMFPSRALHGTDLGNEPDLDARLESAPCRVVQNFRVGVLPKEGGEPVTKEKVAEILEGFFNCLEVLKIGDDGLIRVKPEVSLGIDLMSCHIKNV